MKKRTKEIIIGIILMVVGAAAVVFGEIDDSPGGQLLGLVTTLVGVSYLVVGKKKQDQPHN